MRVLAGSAVVLLGSLALAACATTRAVPRPYPGSPGTPTAARPVPRSADAGAVPAPGSAVEAAESLLGTPYRSGGADPSGFDCSGFVQYVFAKAGVALPRSVREQWQVGTAVERAEIEGGDLVFFAIGGHEVSHVGIALDGSSFVHAPSERGVVRVERLEAEYWSRRYAGARRVTEAATTTRGDQTASGQPGASPSAGIAATPGPPR
jgi:cell wall-associated NlpC family hydrolase